MEFRIADTFTDSLAKLAGHEQKAVKMTAFDLQVNPTGPGMQFHKLDKPKDPNFWSVRVNSSIRIIVHRTDGSLLLCYAGHHDDAYGWAERRKIEMHPKTGAAQLVEVRERVEEIVRLKPAEHTEPIAGMGKAAPLFAASSDEDLLRYGVPAEWLDDVRAATEDTLFDVAKHLPQEAVEALLDLATGKEPETAAVAPAEVDPFSHPDAQRRFRVFTSLDELKQALEYPWEKWSVFLHPSQRQYVERNYNGPARISGSAGTGKTIVALHRAVHVARSFPKVRVLVTTFSKTLANALKVKLNCLTGNQPEFTGRIVIKPIRGVCYDLHSDLFGQPNIASEAQVRSLLEKAAADVEDLRFTPRFLYAEWADVVDPWQIKTWEAYRDVARLGRKTRLGPKQRESLWIIYNRLRGLLEQHKLITWADAYGRLAEHFEAKRKRPFEYAVVDEAQDLGIAELRFLAALGAERPDCLFFAGDLGQRIFQQPFSWKALGVDVRGRSHTLRVNYRTSHQIRTHADRLLPAALADVDGNAEKRDNTISIFDGPAPTVCVYEDEAAEIKGAATWLKMRMAEGVKPDEVGVFVRDHPQRARAKAAIKQAGAAALDLGEAVEIADGKVCVGTMHLAKGLEFRAVAVMACDDEVIPLQERIENVTDDSDLEEVYNTERHLLYVACTRARDHLLVSGVEPASEFLNDLK